MKMHPRFFYGVRSDSISLPSDIKYRPAAIKPGIAMGDQDLSPIVIRMTMESPRNPRAY